MSNAPPDDAPERQPDVNPYQPPATTGRVAKVAKRGLSGGLVGCLVVLASLIAFVGTCVPVGFGIAMQNNRASESFLLVGCLVGLMVAIGTGYGVARALGAGGKKR